MFLRTVLAAFVAALFIGNLSSAAPAADLHLDFRQFPAAVYTGAPASLQWDESVFPIDYMFRYDHRYDEPIVVTAERVYRQAAADMSKRFAGHYVVISTGCGTAIECAVIVDLQTGRIAGILQSATAGYAYRPNSRLLVVNAQVPDDPKDYFLYWEQATYYYAWREGRQGFDLIAEEPWPDRATTGSVSK